jgi:hypothetical protein
VGVNVAVGLGVLLGLRVFEGMDVGLALSVMVNDGKGMVSRGVVGITVEDSWICDRFPPVQPHVKMTRIETQIASLLFMHASNDSIILS